MFHGEEPPDYIDHINGNRDDNRILNLRFATHSQNLQNSKLRKGNKSGHPNVWFSASKNRWLVEIRNGAKIISVQRRTFEEACEFQIKTAQEQHGQFYRRRTL